MVAPLGSTSIEVFVADLTGLQINGAHLGSLDSYLDALSILRGVITFLTRKGSFTMARAAVAVAGVLIGRLL